jgi:hypothetical protein
MKRALLWLGPLACLALACLYAYAWFNRNPLLVAYDRVEQGMALQEAVTIIGQPATYTRGQVTLKDDGSVLQCIATGWDCDGLKLTVICKNDHVVDKYLYPTPRSFVDRFDDLLNELIHGPPDTIEIPVAMPPPAPKK